MNDNSVFRLGRALAKNHASMPQFVRFLVIGGINTAVGYTVFGVAYVLSDDHKIAIVIATVVGTLFNFFSTGRLVFGSRRLIAFIPFVFGYAIICLLNILLVHWLLSIGIEPLKGQALALPLMVLLSYQLN